MKTLRTGFCALFLLGLVAAPPAQAQTAWDLGPILGVNLDSDEFLIGAVARVPLSSLPITVNPGFEFYPGEDDRGGLNTSRWVVNFDVQYELDAESVDPYLGGGISWSRLSVDGLDADSDIGLNVKGGFLFNPIGGGRPYVEAALNFASSDEALIFRGGFLFTIGG